jgi:DNA invertase Pin-like site-specific DNA recombinase
MEENMEQQGQKNTTADYFKYENFAPPEFYSTAIYARFSKDDGQSYDSSSIETQKMMLEKYCKDNGYKVYDFYKDDGYTGLNFDRPNFQRMLRDIEDGKINLVITKDQSRLGRDYIQTGYYTEIYFLDHNVRYIAINDGADTAKPENADFMPFRNIINNMYSKDISRKVKSAKRQRAYNGLFINPQAPYGYEKDPNNKNKLIIDEEAAKIVKEIFRLSLEGKGNMQIAKAITAKRVLVPSAYKTLQGLKGFGHFNKKGKADYDYTWSYTTILNILRDRVYVGDMINRKFEVINYKTKKLVAVPKEKHIVVENTHEPIISREDYERVQQLITARYMPPKHTEQNIFRGLLVCAGCGKRMSLAYRTIKSKGKSIEQRPIFRCKSHYTVPDECSRNNYIYYDDIYNQISASVRNVMNLVKADEATLESARKKADKNANREKLFAEKSKIEKRLGTLSAVMRKLYEDCVTEVLSEGNYQAFIAGYQKEQAVLKEQLTVVNGKLENASGYEESINKLKEYAAAYADQTILTAEMLNKLITRIEIGYPQRSNGKIQQEINIIYRFINTNI